jgi:large subunit ribosomal protein L15
MQQHELRQPKGATHKRKRVGRGNASGHGTYSTKGLKGQKARSGGGVRPGFEGGQLPLVRRMAYKRGFRNPFRVDYEEVNVGALARFPAGAQVDAAALQAERLVRTGRPVKVLGTGEVTVALTVEAASFSKSAKSKIEAAGGSVRWLNGEPPAEAEAEQPAAAPKPKRTRAAKPAPAEAGTEAREEAGDGAGS